MTVKREQKHEIVAELTARLQAADTLLVADYRGLTMPQIDELRSRLLESGARFTVVKNTLTRRAAEAAGADALLALLEGPSAIAFLETDGDMLAAAKALADVARETRVLAIRGGVMQGRAMSAEEVESLATLPPVDVLRGQVIGAIVAPITALAGLLNAPLQNLVGLIDARIEQLGGSDAATAPEAPAGEDEAPAPGARGPEAAQAAADEEPADDEASADAAAPASDDEPTSTENEEA
jgi:large subunit ribosomal protein L10